MSLIKKLRKPWFTNGCEEYQLKAASALEELVEYACHDDECEAHGTYGVAGNPECSCGLSALLKELTDGQ